MYQNKISLYIYIYICYTFSFLYFIHVCINIYLSIQHCITCIVHDLSALGVVLKSKSLGFLTSLWVVYNWFINLGNPFEIVVHYLLIRGMTCLDQQDEFPMMSVVVCMVTHKIGPPVNCEISYKICMISWLMTYFARVMIIS